MVGGGKEGGWQLIIVSVYVHCKTHRKRSDIEMNETLNLHRQRTKWTVDIELDKKEGLCTFLLRHPPPLRESDIKSSDIKL